MSPRAARGPVRRSREPRFRPWTWVLLGLLVVAVASAGLRAVRRVAGPPDRAPQVQVLNGCEVPELAQRAAEQLRARGLDVVSVGNADARSYAETLVLVRRGSPGVAHQVASALGRGRILEQRDPSLLVDVTVVLGRDYAPEAGREPAATAR